MAALCCEWPDAIIPVASQAGRLALLLLEAQPPSIPKQGVVLTEEKKKSGIGKKIGIGCGGLFALVIVLGIIGSFAGSDTGKNAKPVGDAPKAEAPAPLAVTSKELANAYDANEAAAQKKYGGQVLAVTGTVQAIELDMFNNPMVVLNGKNEIMGVQAGFSKDYEDKTAALHKGQKLTVTCEKITEVVSMPVLSDCAI